MGRFGGLLGACRAVLGHLEAILGSLGCILGRLGEIWEPSWALLGPSWPSWRPSWASWRPLGPSLGPLGTVLGASWAVLALSWTPVGRAWGDLDGLLSRLGPSEGRRSAKAKILQKPMENQGFDIFGPSWRASWRPLGPSRRPLGSVGGLLGRLGGILESSWPSWSHLGCLEGEFGGHLGASWPSWRPSRAILEDFFRSLCTFPGLPGGRRDGPEPTGEFFWKKNQNQNREDLARQAPL